MFMGLLGGNDDNKGFLVGQKHKDTKPEINDRLTILAKKTHFKLSSIVIWHHDKICGMEQRYKTNFDGPLHVEFSSGPYKGWDSGTAKMDHFKLDDDEWIVQVSGGAGKIIDRLSFTTNKGRTETYGGSDGDAFTWVAPPDTCFQVFQCCFNGHLHQISVVPDPIGVIPGRGPGYNIAAPPAPGGHPYESKALREGMLKTKICGNINPDTVFFDDWHDRLSTEFFVPEVIGITVYHDGEFIIGIEVLYKAHLNQIQGKKHMGTEAAKANLQTASLILEPFERFVEISGRAGNIIDHLKIVTNTGRMIDVGGTGGNPFDNILSLTGVGSKILGVGGGYGGHMHNLYAYQG